MYKSLLTWSRENIQNSSSNSESNSFNDLDHDLRFSSPNIKDAAKESKIEYEPEASDELNEILVAKDPYVPRRVKFPKFKFEDEEETKASHSCMNQNSKPPIDKKKSGFKMHKSSENPLNSLIKGRKRRVLTQESCDSFSKPHTPNFQKRGIEISDNTSPYTGGSCQRPQRKFGRNS